MHLLPPLPDYSHTSFFLPVGSLPLHEIEVSAFSRSPLGRANTFSFLLLLLTPRKSLSIPPSPHDLTLRSLSHLSFSVTSVLYPPNLSMDKCSISSWFPPIYPSILSRLRYPTLLQLALLLLSPIQPYQLWLATSYCGMFLTKYCHFNFLASLFVSSGYNPSSVLSTVLLVVLDNPS